MERSVSQVYISRVLHFVGDVTSRSVVAAVVTIVVVGSAAAVAASNFSVRWVAAFSTIATSITLVMLFVIQHTQSRQQIATQLKLDELIRATPTADDFLVHIEKAEDNELIEREQDQIAHHTSLREPDGAEQL